MTEYEYRILNPKCNCNHHFYSHGMPYWGYGLAFSGIIFSFILIFALGDIYGQWILLLSMPFSGTIFLMIKNPFRKQCLICKCPSFNKQKGDSV